MPSNEHPELDSAGQLDGVGITPEGEPRFSAQPGPIEISTDLSSDPNVQQLFVRAYSLVSAALLVSAVVASQVPATRDEEFLSNQATLQFLFFFELACVALLARYAPKLPRALAAILLFTCAAINGATFTVFFGWLPSSAISYAFLMCAISFAATAAIARWRQMDLSTPTGIFTLFSVGFGVITATTFALHLDLDYWGTSLTGFVIFASLASYYCDDIRDLDLEFEDDLLGWKSAVCGALILYLNFINLYLLAMRLIVPVFSRNQKRTRGLWL